MNVFQVGGYYSGKCVHLDFLNEAITKKLDLFLMLGSHPPK